MTDNGSVPEMRVNSMLLIQSNFKTVYLSKQKCFFFFCKYLIIVNASGQ